MNMLIEQLLFGLGELFLNIPPIFYLGLFILVFAVAIVISLIFRYHLKKYTFRDYKTGMMRLIFVAGLMVLAAIALVLLVLIFGRL